MRHEALIVLVVVYGLGVLSAYLANGPMRDRLAAYVEAHRQAMQNEADEPPGQRADWVCEPMFAPQRLGGLGGTNCARLDETKFKSLVTR